MERRQHHVRALLAGMALFGAFGTAMAQTQMQMDQQAGAKYRTVDAKLNTLYDHLVLKLDSAQQGRLIEAERAWVKFRDAECAFRTGTARGGSIYPMLVALCRTKLTEARIKQLDVQTTCKTTDLLCGRH